MKLTPHDFVLEYNDAEFALNIYERYMHSEKSLLESNTEAALANFELLSSDNPDVGKMCFGLAMIMIDDNVRPADNFYGKLISKERVNSKYRYTIEFNDGSVSTYPNKVTEKSAIKTILYIDKYEHQQVIHFIKIKHNVTFPPIRK